MPDSTSTHRVVKFELEPICEETGTLWRRLVVTKQHWNNKDEVDEAHSFFGTREVLSQLDFNDKSLTNANSIIDDQVNEIGRLGRVNQRIEREYGELQDKIIELTRDLDAEKAERKADADSLNNTCGYWKARSDDQDTLVTGLREKIQELRDGADSLNEERAMRLESLEDVEEKLRQAQLVIEKQSDMLHDARGWASRIIEGN